MRSRQRIVAFYVVLAAVVLSCGSVMAQSEPEPITLEVVLAGGRDPNLNVIQDYGDISWTQILAEEFEKRYPHIKVEFRTGQMDQIIVMIAAGMGPDIINGYGHKFASLGRQGGFLDLNPLFAAEGVDFMEEQVYWPRQWEAFQYEGRQYAMPQYLGTVALAYNADMFGEAGVPEPEPRADRNTMDWDEFEALAKRLTRDVNGDGMPDIWGFSKSMTRTDRIHYWMAAAGSDFYGNDAKTVSTLNNPAAVQALEYLQKLRWESEVIAPPGVPSGFLEGQTAIAEIGSWGLVNYLGLKSDGTPKVTFDWNLFPMPIGPAGVRATLATNDGYAINRNTKHPEEAYLLLRFLTSREANEIKAKYLGLQPAHRDAVPEYIGLMQEVNRDVYDLDLFVYAEAGAYAHPEVIYADPVLGESILKEVYTKVLDENQPAGPVLAEAIERLNRGLTATAQGPVIERIAWQGQEWVTREYDTVMPGEVRVEGDRLIVVAAGTDIESYKDSFRYVYQEVAGDFTATVRLHSAPPTHNWSKSGLMLRTADTEVAANVAILGTHNRGLVVQQRQAVGSGTEQPARIDSWQNGTPVYMRIIRRGTSVTTQMSEDGSAWQTLAQVTLELPEKVLIGLASTSHAAGTLGEAVFSEWTLVAE